MATDYTLKIDTAPGESKRDGAVDEIDVLSWSWGASQTGTMSYGGGGGGGKVNFNDFTFTMKVNKASPVLYLRCCDGEHLKQAVLTCRKAGGKQQDFLKITFKDLIVTSYSIGGSNGSDDIPMESFSLSAAQTEFLYKEQKIDGTLAAGTPICYDQKLGKKV